MAFYTAKGRISRHDMRPFASLFAVYKKVVRVVKVVKVVKVVRVVKVVKVVSVVKGKCTVASIPNPT